ncbi:MAG TPA: helix-turn-helix transcriptional regulator [Cyclobacteriaceae bacterium]|nr:helix-turn-helix transcriptional regulator [Cyclobacteriaceae bacterium]
MSKYQLGEFEEVVLLTVAILSGEAYGVSIIDEIEKRLKRKVSLGAMQTSLRRLEEKGFLKSELGEATKMRGGKRKRYFVLTNFGKKALKESKDQRLGLWNAVPEFALN